MDFTNRDIVQMIDNLSAFRNRRLPQRISYAITRNLMILNDVYSSYEEELAKTLLSYEDDLVKDDNGEIFRFTSGIPAVKDSISDDLNKELEELLGIVVSVNLHTIRFEEFDYSDGEKYDALSPNELVTLQNILCKTDPGETK